MTSPPPDDETAWERAADDDTGYDDASPREPEQPSPDAAHDDLELRSLEVPRTGDAELDDMLVILADTASLSPAEQLPAIEAVHRGLQDRLADTEG